MSKNYTVLITPWLTWLTYLPVIVTCSQI